MTNNEKAIEKIQTELAPDVQWREIIDKIVDEIGETELPDDVVRCTELLISGYPTYKAAKTLGVSQQTVRRWLEKYPAMAMAVKHGRELMTTWRMSKLEQQFLVAVEKSEEILDTDLSDSQQNAKLIAAVAQQARFIISLFAGQKSDINITMSGEGQLLKTQTDALDYLAEKLQSQRASGEVVEASYRIVDVAESPERQPLLDENGNPPFGTIGELDANQDGILCHVCGERLKNIKAHAASVHKLNWKEYSAVYMLPRGALESIVHGEETTTE